MADARETFALFRVAAGARIGFGHLRRATVLARTLDRRCAISIRGDVSPPVPFDAAPGTPEAALARSCPRLLVIDDPRANHARPWLNAARRAGVPCASLHDLGLGAIPSDLAVDGSLAPRRHWPSRAVLSGPRFAVLGGTGLRRMPHHVRAHVARVIVTLGGGRHRALTRAIVWHLRSALPGVRVIVPTGCIRDDALAALAGDRVELVDAPDGVGGLLASADVAVVGGGLTLYEAALAAVPAVALPVVSAQRRTVQTFVRAGLAFSVSGGSDNAELGRRVARRVAQLAADTPRRRSMSALGPATIDGRGAARVARALVALTEAADA